MSVLGKSEMNLQQYKALWIVVTAVLALLVASPALQRVLVYPQTDFFTELSLLGPGHMAEDYPFNITQNENYTVYLGITNHLGSCAYYEVQVKFRNETESAPNSFNQTASTLPSLYNVLVFVADKESCELPVTFSFDYSLFNKNQVVFNSLTFNGASLSLAGLSTDWNSTMSVFYGNLVFELWIYNGATNTFQYNARFVDLKFNMTSN